ncbi:MULTISPECIES: MurR/RpiR family transcriptional regulator [Clostridia]|uniref:MurR/RpiR family transcriptional regulator n=1 Tax=Clostridia TaxID=186801 RepID=UPI00067E6DA3|nr:MULTISPECIES: MurR/RpiR family transcriptional regulator [Clostridia]
MYIVAYRLINLLNDSEYDSTEAHIAESLLGMIKDIEHMPIDQVADKCHISKSTLSKFVKRLGFEDYKEFRDNARNEKKRAGYHNYEEKVPMDRFIEQYGIERFLSVLSGDIEHFLSGIDRNQIRELAKALHQYKKVAAFGSVYSETVAMDFMYEIAGVGKYIKTNIYDVKQEQYINEADEDTLIIIFSNSGQYIYENGMKPLDQSRSFVRKTKGRIALITSNREAASDPSVSYPVLYHFTTRVQNHPFIERIIAQMIVEEFKCIGGGRSTGP